MAQDFYAVFGLVEDDRHIGTVDADGVALAAVQALYRLVLQKDSDIRRQQAELQQGRIFVEGRGRFGGALARRKSDRRPSHGQAARHA